MASRGKSLDESPWKPMGAFLSEHLDAGGDLNEWFARDTAQRARNGDTEAAQSILKDFVEAMDARSEKMWPQLGPPIHWVYARYLADAFKLILQGKEKDAALALGIKSSKPGRRRNTGAKHNLEALAAAYNVLLLNGLEPKQAKLHLKEQTGSSVRTIEKANQDHVTYRTYLSAARHLETPSGDRDLASGIIKVGAAPYAAALERILKRRKSS
jgi:hypothetical protein